MTLCKREVRGMDRRTNLGDLTAHRLGNRVVTMLKAGRLSHLLLERVLELSPEEQLTLSERLARKKKAGEKRRLRSTDYISVAGPFTFEVPAGFVSHTSISEFRRRMEAKAGGAGQINPNFTDSHYFSPAHILEPGEKLMVEVYAQETPFGTTSSSRLSFLYRMGALHVGAQGAALLSEMLLERVPVEYGHCSFCFYSTPDRLWRDEAGVARIPCLKRGENGGVCIRLLPFNEQPSKDHLIVCVTGV